MLPNVIPQYRKYRPSTKQIEENKPRALLRFAGTAILAEVRERRHRWTWPYFAQRRDDRHRYVDLFKEKLLESISASVCTVGLKLGFITK